MNTTIELNIYMNKEEIIKSYLNGKSCRQIAKELDIWPGKILRILHNSNIEIRKQKGFVKDGEPWNRGKCIENTNKILNNGEILQRSVTCVRKHMKRFLINKNGHKCEICGLTNWNGKPIPLVCDHINGDTTDSRIENFRVVCCNCDAQLPTYKSKNKKDGDIYNREYYHKRKVKPIG